MKKLALLALVSTLALAVVASAGAASNTAKTAKDAGAPTKVLHFLDTTTSFQANFSFQQGPKLGDRMMFTDAVYLWNGTKRGARVGSVAATIVSLGGNRTQLSAVAHLPGGEIMVFGDAGQARVSHYAVIGGTGVYAGARGEITVVSIGGEQSNKSAITIRLWQ